MQDARTRIALIVIGLVCLLGSGFVLMHGRASPPPVIITPPPADAPMPQAATPPAASPPDVRVYVDVAGAVRRPSLYVLPTGSRVMQAIRAAGGPTGSADLDAVNLAEKVQDGEKVFVPKRSASAPSAPATEAGQALTGLEGRPMTSLPKAPGKAGKGERSGHSNKLTADSGEQIALDTATSEQLQRLPGVGPSMAGRILAYRQQAGGFGKIEDLMQVTGIGPKKFAKIAPLVKVD